MKLTHGTSDEFLAWNLGLEILLLGISFLCTPSARAITTIRIIAVIIFISPVPGSGLPGMQEWLWKYECLLPGRSDVPSFVRLLCHQQTNPGLMQDNDI